MTNSRSTRVKESVFFILSHARREHRFLFYSFHTTNNVKDYVYLLGEGGYTYQKGIKRNHHICVTNNKHTHKDVCNNDDTETPLLMPCSTPKPAVVKAAN